MARSTTRGSRVAGSNASTSIRTCTHRSSMPSSPRPAQLVLGDPRDNVDDSRAGRARPQRRRRSRHRSTRPSPPARARCSIRHSSQETKRGLPYMAPQALVDVDHTMRDHERGNVRPGGRHHAPCGTTQKAIRTHERQPLRPHRLGVDQRPRTGPAGGRRVETGTWYMNRCDYLDPELAWVGVKDSGRGCSLSDAWLRATHTAQVVPSATSNRASLAIARVGRYSPAR